MKKMAVKSLCWYLVLMTVIIGMASKVHAGFSPSEAIGLFPSDRTSDLQKVQKITEIKMVQERLNELGFTSDEIQKRLDQLSNDQLHQMASQLDELQVGGDGLGVVAVLLLIAILNVLNLYLSGHRLAMTK